MIGCKVGSVRNDLSELDKGGTQFFNCLAKLFSPAGKSFTFWIKNAAHPCVVHPVLDNMFNDNEKNCNQPEEISKKPGDLEDPHWAYSLYFKDKGLILLTNLPVFVFVKYQDFQWE